MELTPILVCVLLTFKLSTSSLSPLEVSVFLKQLVKLENGPRAVVSLLNMGSGETRRMAKEMADDGILFCSAGSIPGNVVEEHTIFVADFLDDVTTLLEKAESLGLLKSPSKWVLFLDMEEINEKRLVQSSIFDGKVGEFNDNDEKVMEEDDIFNEELIIVKKFVNWKLSDVDIRVFSEVMIVFVHEERYDAKMGGTYSFNWNQNYKRRIRQGGVHNHCDRHIDPMSKVNYYFTSHMVEFMNGSARVDYVDSWGYRQPDGTYDGLVHELASGRADIAGSPLIMNKDRMRWVEYVCVNSPMKTLFIFRKPPLSTVANIFILPFSAGVWLTTLAMVVIMSACVLLTWTWEDAKTHLQQGRTIRERAADAFLDSLCLVFQQGTWKEPKFSSGRTVLLFGLVSFMFLFTAYSAYIVALLQSTTNSINTLEDLLASPLRLAVQDTLYNRFFFPTETEPVRKAIWQQKLVPRGDKTFLPVEVGIDLLRQGLFGFHVERTTAYYLVQKTFYEEEKCQFKEIEFLQITHPYFSIARDSPFKELFKIGSKRVMESGLQGRSNARILTGAPRCAGAGGGGGGSFVAVQLADCAPALHCLLLGCALALLTLAAELAVHRRERVRLQGNQNGGGVRDKNHE